MTRNVNGAWPALLCLGLAFGLAGAGCKKSESTGGNAPGGPVMMPPGGTNQSPQDVLAKLPGGDEFAAGKKVYADNNCARCHKLGETGGGMAGGPPGAGGGGMTKGSAGGPPGGMANGPDLTKVGAEPERTAAWLGDHIRNAKTHKPESKMPTFGPDKITDADLAQLAAYLAARK